jgi:integrase
LFLDFRLNNRRVREQTSHPDTPANRKRLEKLLATIEADIERGTYSRERAFGSPQTTSPRPRQSPKPLAHGANSAQTVPTFDAFGELWFAENKIQWRRSYQVTQRGALDKYLLPHFGQSVMSEISKADVLAFRTMLSQAKGRSNANLSPRRVNAVMKPLRQILAEAADRFSFSSPFRGIKPLKAKRSEVQPFTIEEVKRILATVRPDYRPYLVVRFFTGMRTGELHGLKWKNVDFGRRLILVRESFVLGEDDDLKTDGSQRDLYMTKAVHDALRQQFQRTGAGEYVFSNRVGKPIDNKNFVNRVWNPLLRSLGLAVRRPYHMRHTAATLWLASGEAPEWIARQLGHTTTEMLFRVYSRYVPNLTRQDGSAFDRVLEASFAG